MMGLIWKDFLVIKKTLLYMLVVAILFGGVYTSMDSNYFLTFFLSIMTVSILLSTLSYDEFYHWDRYAATLPVSRPKLVIAKYLGSYILFFIGAVFAAWLQLGAMYFRGESFTVDTVATMAIAPAIGLIGTAVVLPCSYRFGVQKSRLAMLVFYGVPSLLLVLALRFMPDAFARLEQVQMMPWQMVVGLYAVTAVLQGVSILISVRVMEGKEL